jgi:hypothetical protein
MSCDWTRSYIVLQPGQCTTQLCCNGNCNYSLTVQPGSIAADFAEAVTTCAQAFTLIGQQLKKRLSAKNVIVFAGSTNAYIMNIQLGTGKNDTARVVMQTTYNCMYPINCIWTRTKNSSSGSGSFQSVNALISYLVENLRT